MGSQESQEPTYTQQILWPPVVGAKKKGECFRVYFREKRMMLGEKCSILVPFNFFPPN